MVTLSSRVPNGTPNTTEKHPHSTTAPILDEEERTDLERWRLLDERGRQTWHYMSSDEDAKAWPQTIADRHHLGLPLVRNSLSRLK